jgi:hypothetical protein
MLIVVTPAASTRLTTIARARAVLGTANTDAENIKLGMLLDQASAVAANYCGRTLVRETVKESFIVPRAFCDAEGALLLDRAPVVSITSVTTHGDLLDAADYELDPVTGALYRLSGTYRHPWRGVRTDVVYVAGYTVPNDDVGGTWTLPADIERAVINLASAYRSTGGRNPLVKSETVEGVGSTSWWDPAVAGSGPSLPDPEAAGLLRPYRFLKLG